VLVLEKGKRFGKADFPKDNRDLKRWMWKPRRACTASSRCRSSTT
jgi:hypothetical protein